MPSNSPYIQNPLNSDPLHLLNQVMQDSGMGGSIVDMLMGGVQFQRQQNEFLSRSPNYADPAGFSEEAADRERAKNKAREASSGAKNQHALETQSEESVLERLIGPVNSFEHVSREALRPRQ